MTAYLARRLLLAVPVLLGVSIIVFSIVHLVPGDPALAIAGEKATKRDIERVTEQYGLDRPVAVQYLEYIGKLLLHGDFGKSFKTKMRVSDDMKRCFPATIELTLAAMLLATLLGVAFGIVSAVRPYSWLDYASMLLALVGVSVPIFFLGMLLLLAFGGILPGSGRLDPNTTLDPITHFISLDCILGGRWDVLVDFAKHLALPAAALSTVPMALVARMTRSSMLEVLSSDYVRTARAKGVAERVVVLRHALRNALVPIVTTLGMEFGHLLAGAVLTETVFSWPGIGSYVVDAVNKRDFIALQAGTLVIAVSFIAVNLLVDVGYVFINPRIRYGHAD